jgi:hypothetical protein
MRQAAVELPLHRGLRALTGATQLLIGAPLGSPQVGGITNLRRIEIVALTER